MSVPPHLETVAVATRHCWQLPIDAIGEIVQEVAGDQVFGEHVGAVLLWKRGGGDEDGLAAGVCKSFTTFMCKVWLSTKYTDVCECIKLKL